jgi:hypothetical protein
MQRGLDLKTTVTTADGERYEVSTVELPFAVPALVGGIFTGRYETMVFRFQGDEASITDFTDHYADRYQNATAARAGHERVCAALQSNTLPLY